MANKPNPYQPTNPTPTPPTLPGQTMSRWKMAVWMFAYVSPFLAMSTIYLSWLIAWTMLGHPPRPMIDDPKFIGGAMDFAYPVSCVAVLLMPAFAIMGLIACWLFPIHPRAIRMERGFPLMIAYILGCSAIWILARIDPGRIVEWWFD